MEYNTKEFANELNCSVRTLEDWRSKRSMKLLPARYDGRKAIYTSEQIPIAKAMLGRIGENLPMESLFGGQGGEGIANAHEQAAPMNATQEKNFSQDTCGDSSGEYTADETPQNFQSTFDTLDTAADNVTSFEMADVESISAAVNSDNDSSVVETAAYAPIVETPPFIEDMAVPLEEKTLQELAVEGRLCFERGDEHLKQGAKYYIEGGRRLVEAKRRLKHGQWLPWLKENFSFSEDSAINRMNLAKRFGDSNSESIRNLSYTKLIKLLALPVGSEEEFIEAQADAGRPVESQTVKEVKDNIKAFKQNQARSADTDSGEVGGGNYFGVWKDNQGTVDELKHADSGRYEPREDVPDTEGDNLPDNAKIDSEADTGEDFQLTPEPPPVEVITNPDKPSTGTVHYGTPDKYIEAARKVLGAIDLDPATFAEAQKHVKAKKFYTVEDNGLDKPWSDRVWLNPPYNTKKQKGSTIEQFIEKLISEVALGNVTSAIVLTDAKTDTNWFRRLVDAGAAIVFTTQRINFMQLNGTFAANTGRYGQAFFYFGDDADKFYRVFAPFGWGCRVVKLPAEKEKGLFDVGEAVETC